MEMYDPQDLSVNYKLITMTVSVAAQCMYPSDSTHKFFNQ
jgi:hypothetical protein